MSRREQFIKEIKLYSNLPDNWDSYDGVAPSQEAVNDALELLTLFEFVPERVSPCGDGEICFYWDDKDQETPIAIFADFGVQGNGKYSCYIEVTDMLERKKEYFRDNIDIRNGLDNEIEQIFRNFYA